MRRRSAPVAVAAVAAVVLWIGMPDNTKMAAIECLRPTTVEMLPLPEACVETNESPPPDLIRSVEAQRAFYELTLQKLVTCRTTNPVVAVSMLSEELRQKWLPLYVGCCSYQAGRHVVVVAGGFGDKGPVMVQAALIQSRWAYFRANWRKRRP